MDKLQPTPIYLITEPKEDFQRTDEFTILDKTGNVISYLEKRTGMVVLTKEEFSDAIRLAIIYGAEFLDLYKGYPANTDKEEYLKSLFK